MTLKKVAGISIAALMAVMMATTAQAAENGKYVQNSAGEAVKNSNEGTCVQAQFGSMPEGCEAAPPKPEPPKPQPPKPQPPQKLVLNADANFDFDKATLKPAGKANLDQFMAGMGGAKVSAITVVGHTDSVGTDAYNQGLSERRASSVAGYLSSKGVPAAAIQASGKGESQPVADNGTKAGRAANRRVEVTANTVK
ncbi:MAG: OmpA family protein [Thiothrix sp.]|jgi:OOP family OmpA-OmpF porin|uniref:OmpA family protein n=1 Tax=Thiothrix sp. TaxID=1032 RepID=UPI00262B33EF|nr:OmpA family protein [Thiothrix sp.]MDD5391493.1 OmpA family protein [Thiothrix sp.]